MEDPTLVATSNEQQPLTVYHLIMFLDGQVSLNRGLIKLVQQALDSSITTPPEQTAIDVWIESNGGDAHAAYKLFLDLRSRCHQLRGVVPDYAKSAATLLLMGMDQIFMTAASELGPLDVQLEHPDREELTISGLEVAGSLEFVTRTALIMVLTGGGSLVEITGLPRAPVLKETFGFMSNFYRPIVEKFDPHLVSQASKQLKIAERYATTMLKKRRVPVDRQLNDEATKKLLNRLVRDYPAHEFIISREEASDLGLPIQHAEAHPRWVNIKRLYNAPREEGCSMICVLPDAEIDRPEHSRAVTATEEGHEEGNEEANLHHTNGDGNIEAGRSGESSTAQRGEATVRAKASSGD